jgi:hypothetical protein
MKKNRKIIVQGSEIVISTINGDDYISLTDIAKYREVSETDDVIKNWMRNRSTIEFLGLWEKLNNPFFNPVESDGFKTNAGSNNFVLSPSKWIKHTNAKGIVTKSGRYGGGTYAHKDIAFEFASWVSSEFKLYLITEFQRLKDEEKTRIETGWDVKRMLSKINYRIHTDAIRNHLIPPRISQKSSNLIYANEADILNMALFGITAKEWRDNNTEKDGNIRDVATVEQLVVLVNLESLNSQYIKEGMSQNNRLIKLNQIAISQMESLLANSSIKKLESKTSVRTSF